MSVSPKVTERSASHQKGRRAKRIGGSFLALLDFINNRWIVGLGSSLGSGLLLIGLTSESSLLTKWLRVLGSYAAEFSAPLVQVGIAILVLPVGKSILTRWRSWRLVKFRDTALSSALDPTLRIVRRLRKRSMGLAKLRMIAQQFWAPTGECYYEVLAHDALSELTALPVEEGEKPHLVLKLPARQHLALADIYDLRLLQKFLIAGGEVTVLIIDVPKDDTRVEDIEQAVTVTCGWVRRFLGTSAQVKTLSRLVGDNERQIVEYFLRVYIPWLEESLTERLRFYEAEPGRPTSLNVSYLVFALFTKALETIGSGKKPIFVVQWRERLYKWFELKEFVRGPYSSVHLGGLVVGNSLLSPTGEKIPTARRSPADSMFHFTDDIFSIARVIFAVEGTTFVVSDRYLEVLGRSLLGVSLRATARHQPGLRQKHRQLYQRYRTFLDEVAHMFPEATIHLRLIFLEELLRIKRQLKI